MAKGENIFKRKDGRWEARYVKGHEVSGKIRYGYCYGKTYKEAEEKVTRCKAALLSGQTESGIKGRHRFAYYCDEWLRTGKSLLKESTYVKYNAMVKKYIKPKLGSCYPLGMCSSIVDAFRDELLYQEGLAPKTVKDILVVLRSILKYTAKAFPGSFPAIDITYPKEVKKEMRVLTVDEQRRFVAYLTDQMDPCKFGVLLALHTGLRIGEICALQWGNISLNDGVIKVNATMQRLEDPARLEDPEGSSSPKTKVVIGPPKSDSSLRMIPMSNSVTELCRKMHPYAKDAYVLSGTNSYIEPRTLQYRLEKYTRECGLEGVHFHALRHTFATRCVEVGFEIKSLSEILGHASTTITLDRYVHSTMELKRNNMNKLAVIGL